MAVSRRSYLAAKRMLDIVLGVVLLVLSLPFMLLIAIAIGLGSRGPVLFLQPRVGKAGKVFPLAKFRTMKAGNDDSIHREYYEQLVRGTAEPRVNSRGEPVYLLDDPRITRVGRFLRRTSLDELPNLFNVLA
jgi:lipopolysaccharide/colanic/teichoic acid biosynthesis glycosyltransferase